MKKCNECKGLEHLSCEACGNTGSVKADEGKRLAGERERFEAELVVKHGYQPKTLRGMRHGERYISSGLNLAWDAWQARSAQPAPVVPEGWRRQRPVSPGAYYVRGFRLGESDYRPALVEVVCDEDGGLVCNIHQSNSQDDLYQWSLVSDCSDRFEWLGPLGDAEQLQEHIRLLSEAYVRAGEREHNLRRRLYAAPAPAVPELLPFWEPCNPGCDPDFNGSRSRYCAELCHSAREALVAAPVQQSRQKPATEDELRKKYPLQMAIGGEWTRGFLAGLDVAAAPAQGQQVELSDILSRALEQKCAEVVRLEAELEALKAKVPGEFLCDDGELQNLLNVAVDISSGRGNMDDGLLFMDLLESVQARLSDSAELAALKAQQVDADQFGDAVDEAVKAASDNGHAVSISVAAAMLDAALVALKAQQVGQEPIGYAALRDGRYGCWLHPTKEMAEIHDKTALAGKPAGSEIVALYTAPQSAPAQDVAEPNIEAAAKMLAMCMDYPWEPMPEVGRNAMRRHAQAVLAAAHDKQSGEVKS